MFYLIIQPKILVLYPYTILVFRFKFFPSCILIYKSELKRFSLYISPPTFLLCSFTIVTTPFDSWTIVSYLTVYVPTIYDPGSGSRKIYNKIRGDSPVPLSDSLTLVRVLGRWRFSVSTQGSASPGVWVASGLGDDQYFYDSRTVRVLNERNHEKTWKV